MSAQERLAALLTADAVLRLAHWMVEHLADDQPLGEVWDVIRPAIRTAYEAGAAGVSVPAEPGAPDRETCANCLRVVDEVDAETGECRECYVRFTSQPVPAEPGAPDPLRAEAVIARDVIANFLWNEDDSGDEDQLEGVYDRLCAVLGERTTEESAGATLALMYGDASQPVPAPEASALREAGDDLYRALSSEHGHGPHGEAPWPACLPVHIAMNRWLAATPQDPEP